MEEPRLNLSVKFLATVKHNKLLPALTCLPVPIGLLTVVSSNSEMLNDRIPRPYTLLPFLNDSDAEFKLDPANQFTFDNEVERLNWLNQQNDNGKLIDQGSYDYLSKKFNFENFSR